MARGSAGRTKRWNSEELKMGWAKSGAVRVLIRAPGMAPQSSRKAVREGLAGSAAQWGGTTQAGGGHFAIAGFVRCLCPPIWFVLRCPRLAGGRQAPARKGQMEAEEKQRSEDEAVRMARIWANWSKS
jgi:hypothetical protein